MNFTCAICTDLLTPPDDIFRTPCGHIFHFTCLSEWLRRSPTCPQCREKTPSHKIHRLYFNFCNNDHITDEILSLRDKVNKLTCQLAQKVKDIKYYSEKAETIEKQIPGKKRETQDLLQTIDKMKQQLNYIRKQASETDSLKKTNKQLRKKLEIIQTLRKAFQKDIDDMDTGTADNNFCIMMRKEINSVDLSSNMKSLQQKLSKTTMEKEFLSEDTSTKFVTLLCKHNLKYCIYFSLHLLASSFFPYASYSI
ncbi:E3 ubiquitin-protein ligase TRAIP isoform X2 [Megalopta genalis]|uniref:E3 ubiquitin-protein ligase TRAIP isoform X2 n=1 Tax=Megalopta genalis TaxID=115081 RepID=UPI003FD3E72D